jgi:polysaccharide export outer membrane protein
MRFVLCCALATALLGCGARQTTDLPPVPSRETVLEGAALGPGDVVEVRVYQEKDLTGDYRVDADGQFDFPLIGAVKAEGLTAGELAQQIETLLKEKYLRDPQVSVFVKEFNSKKVFVLGQVKKPGTFKFEDRMTIVQLVTLAGGFTNLAARDRTVLTRVVEGEERKFMVPVESIGTGTAQNVLLQPGDIVFVPESVF